MAAFEKDDHSDLAAALDTVDPATFEYGDWARMMAGWKDAGLPYEAIDSWNRRDPARYDATGNRRTWDSFNGTGVGSGTVAWLIREHGGTVPTYAGNAPDAQPITQRKNYVPADPCEQLAYAVRALFEPGELVNIITDAQPKAGDPGKFNPVGHGTNREAGELLQALEAQHGDDGLEAVIGPYNREAGVWWRANPVDGNGTADANITRFDHALLECDSGSVAAQVEAAESMGLPVAYVAHSGNKSAHIIVNIDAGTDAELYAERAKTLYAVAAANGMEPDGSCASRSKLSRLPGAMRNGKRQALLKTGLSGTSWQAWRDGRLPGLIAERPATANADGGDLPAIEHVNLHDIPASESELIEGVLRCGDKAIMTAASKAGKTFAVIELAIAVATGGLWFGRRCKQGRVLVIDFEMRKSSYLRRVRRVVNEQRGAAPPGEAGRYDMGAIESSVDVWFMRGKVLNMEWLVNELQTRIAPGDYDLIILDPIYKLLAVEGDENTAKDVARFCAQVDRLSDTFGCSTFFTHHHSKGAKGDVAAIDRGSGSGVFGRDPDAIMDMTEIFPADETDALPNGASAYELHVTLRDFPPVPVHHVIWSYPLHRIDNDGDTADWKASTSQAKAGKESGRLRKAEAEADRLKGELAIAALFAERGAWEDGVPAKDARAAAGGIEQKTLRTRLDNSELFELKTNAGGNKSTVILKVKPTTAPEQQAMQLE